MAEMMTILGWGAIALAAMIALGVYKVGKKNKTLAMIGLVVGGIFLLGGISGLNLQALGGTGAASGGVSGTCDQQHSIATLTGVGKDEVSGAYDISGVIQFFEPDADLSDPTVGAIDTITLSSGSASSTAAVIRTCTPYRVVYQGDGNSQDDYDKDLGVMELPLSNFNLDSSALTFDIGGTFDVAAIEDPVEEDNGDGANAVNGQSGNNTLATATNEVGCAAGCSDADTLVYDESQGDGSFYIDMKFGATGTDSIIQNMVLVPDYDSSNPPEGNEYSSITASTRTGSLTLPNDILSFWTAQNTIAVADRVNSGDSTTIRFTYAITEANVDTNDDWCWRVDDNGGYLKDDVTSGNKGATAVSQCFDAQA